MICGSGGSKSRLAQAAGAEPSVEIRDEKLHAVVPCSTVRINNMQSTSTPEHFWRLRCRKSARCCGAKQIKGLTPPAADPRFTPVVELDVFLWLTPRPGWGPTGQLPFCLNDALLWTFDRELPGQMCCGRHART